jgi:hypothetical protein
VGGLGIGEGSRLLGVVAPLGNYAWRYATMDGEKKKGNNLVAGAQSPPITTLDDLELEWLIMRASAFQDWQRKSMAVLETQVPFDKNNER